MRSIPGSQRQPVLGDGKLLGKFGKLLGKFFQQSPVLSTHRMPSKHGRGGARSRLPSGVQGPWGNKPAIYVRCCPWVAVLVSWWTSFSRDRDAPTRSGSVS